MTDSRPEITAKADGANVWISLKNTLLTVDPMENSLSTPLTPEEALALQCQLATAMEQATIFSTRANTVDSAKLCMPTEEQIQVIADRNGGKTKTWRDRAIEEPML